MFKKFFQNKFLYLGIALMLMLYPSVSDRPAESELKTVVTAVGLDLVEEGLEITLNIVVPKTATDVNANIIAVSEKGETVDEAMNKISYALGRWVGLAHCESVIFNSALFEQDVTKYLDFFIRTNNLTTNSLLFMCTDTAKTTLNLMTQSTQPYAQVIKNLIEFDDNMHLPIKMNIQNFYKAYYSPQAVAVVGVIDTKETQTSSSSSSSTSSNAGSPAGGDQNLNSSNLSTTTGSSTGSSTGGSTGQGKMLYNQNNMVLIKNGKLALELSDLQKQTLNLFSNQVIPNVFIIHDVTIAELSDATVTMEVYTKNISFQSFFNNRVPVFNINAVLNLKFDEANAEQYNEQSLDEMTSFLYEPVKDKIFQTIRQNLSDLIQSTLEQNIDVFAVYDHFYKNQNKAWKQYLSSLSDPEEYLNGVLYNFNLKLYNKL